MKLYIIVCILHDAYIDNLFTEFKRQNITQYPYFFIGLNWLDDAVIKENDITSIAAGSVGTQPWQPMKMPITTYDDEDVNEVIETPNHLNSELVKNIKLTSDTPENTFQPNPDPQDLSEV